MVLEESEGPWGLTGQGREAHDREGPSVPDTAWNVEQPKVHLLTGGRGTWNGWLDSSPASVMASPWGAGESQDHPLSTQEGLMMRSRMASRLLLEVTLSLCPSQLSQVRASS